MCACLFVCLCVCECGGGGFKLYIIEQQCPHIIFFLLFFLTQKLIYTAKRFMCDGLKEKNKMKVKGKELEMEKKISE